MECLADPALGLFSISTGPQVAIAVDCPTYPPLGDMMAIGGTPLFRVFRVFREGAKSIFGGLLPHSKHVGDHGLRYQRWVKIRRH